MEMDDSFLFQNETYYSELRPMLAGAFRLFPTHVPYFQSILSLRAMVTELEPIEGIPIDVRATWDTDLASMRTFDSTSVGEEIVQGYLRRGEPLKFFSSLTVVLLPVDATRAVLPNYGDAMRLPALKESLTQPPWAVTNVGPIQIVTNTETPHGYIRWDRKRVLPVTIDGQHRLTALRRLYYDGCLSSDALESTVSVLFLVLDERAGFQISKSIYARDSNPIVGAMSELFRHLNRHVSRRTTGASAHARGAQFAS